MRGCGVSACAYAWACWVCVRARARACVGGDARRKLRLGDVNLAELDAIRRLPQQPSVCVCVCVRDCVRVSATVSAERSCVRASCSIGGDACARACVRCGATSATATERRPDDLSLNRNGRVYVRKSARVRADAMRREAPAGGHAHACRRAEQSVRARVSTRECGLCGALRADGMQR
jgi:hypothetical protein